MIRKLEFGASVLACTVLGAAYAPQALAWGHTGHVFISELATAALPDEVPAFLRSAAAVREIGELGPEPDISKSSGDASTPNSDVHDFERDPGHFIDLDDSGNVESLAAVPLSGLLGPGNGRRDFDTALRAASGNRDTQYDGYLPYRMVDDWQQVRKDLAYYRAYSAAIANPATAAADRDVFQYQLALRQALILRDIGVWSHYVGDGSQPMHVSIHYNGWGNYPNPNGYTTQPIHAPFEGFFVRNFVSLADVQRLVGPYVPCNCAGIENRVKSYLLATLATIPQTYQLEQSAGGNAYMTYNAAEQQFITSRLAAGATELRDEIVDAWRSSDTIYVGYPLIKVTDIESGAVVLTPSLIASD